MHSGLFLRRRFIGLVDIIFNITILTIDPLKFDPIHQEPRLISNPAIRPETSPHIHRSIIFELTSIANESKITHIKTLPIVNCWSIRI
jgi:hypothetical protein